MNGSHQMLVALGQCWEPALVSGIESLLGALAVSGGSGGGAAIGSNWVVGLGVALLGVAALAADSDLTDLLSELADRAERLEAGDAEVTFPTDRDDELGRLAAALDSLADRVTDGADEPDDSVDEERADIQRTSWNEESWDLERYRAFTDDVIDAIDDVFYVLDEEGDLLRWNETLASVTGYTDEEIAEMHALEFFDGEERDRIAGLIENVFETGEQRVESELVTSDGTHIPYEFIATRLLDPEGNSVLAGIGRDITDQLERERRLRERERELSTLMDNIPGMVYRAGNERDWPFEFVSDGCREVTGYDPGTLVSGEVNWAEDVLVDDNDELWETVQQAVENRESYRVTFEIEIADGDRRWVWEQGRGIYDDDGNLDALEGVILDITEQKTRETELERTTDFLEQTQRIANVGGWELDLQGGPPFTGSFTDELYQIHDLPVGTEIELERGLEFYHPDHRDRVREAVERAMETGERYELEARFVTAEGDERWVRTSGIPVYEDGELVTLRGALQDITAQKEHELALESLQEMTQGLLGTETRSDVAEFVVERATAFLDAPCLAIYMLDDETNNLDPAAVSDAFADLCGDPAPIPIDRGDSLLWDAFVSGEQQVVGPKSTEDSYAFAPAVDRGLVIPLGDYGVFVLATPDPRIDDETRRLAETIAATTEAALDRLESETLLRERESELASRNRGLRRQMQINNIIRSIHTSLIGAESRAEIEQTVCERLVAAEDVRFAWIGTIDAEHDEMGIRAWDGTGQEYLDELSLAVEGDEPVDTPLALDDATTGEDEAGDASAVDGTATFEDGFLAADVDDGVEPSVLTARTGEATVVGNVVEGLGTADWRQRALLRDFHSIVSVPLSVDDFSIGVLTVYADEPDAFSDLEGTVFTELGESIANAIAAVNTRRALHAETLVELTVRLQCDSFFTRIAQAADCQIQYEGLAAHSGEESRLFFTTVGADAETVLAVLDDLVSVTDARLVGVFEDECLFEVTVTEETVPARLARHGGRLRSVHVEGDALEIVVEVPPTTDVREFLEMLEEEYAAVELLSRRDVERSIQTRQEFLEYLLADLTDRQLEVLRTAYYAGFFEWPRASTGEDIAEMLGVTQPTVNRHLRLGQQRLLEALFEQSVSETE